MARCRQSPGRLTGGGCSSCVRAADARGVGRAAAKEARMARRRKRRTLKPRVPSRVKRRKRAKKADGRGHQHPELIGLGLVALGVFLGLVVWAGWNGGYVGGWIGEGLEGVLGRRAHGLA